VIFEATSTRLIKVIALALLIGVAVGILSMNLFDPNRSARLAMLERDHARMQTLIRRTELHNRDLERELRGLEEGLGAWYEVARREHGMVLEGEVIFRFPVD